MSSRVGSGLWPEPDISCKFNFDSAGTGLQPVSDVSHNTGKTRWNLKTRGTGYKPAPAKVRIVSLRLIVDLSRGNWFATSFQCFPSK